jgi:DNA-nicking Smr family endonuclease
MSPLSEDKLVSFLAEISDIRQIKSDLQTLVMLLKQQEKATIPASFADGDHDHTAEPAESGQSASPEDVLRYLRETRGEDDMGE